MKIIIGGRDFISVDFEKVRISQLSQTIYSPLPFSESLPISGFGKFSVGQKLRQAGQE